MVASSSSHATTSTSNHHHQLVTRLSLSTSSSLSSSSSATTPVVKKKRTTSSSRLNNRKRHELLSATGKDSSLSSIEKTLLSLEVEGNGEGGSGCVDHHLIILRDLVVFQNNNNLDGGAANGEDDNDDDKQLSSIISIDAATLLALEDETNNEDIILNKKRHDDEANEGENEEEEVEKKIDLDDSLNIDDSYHSNLSNNSNDSNVKSKTVDFNSSWSFLDFEDKSSVEPFLSPQSRTTTKSSRRKGFNDKLKKKFDNNVKLNMMLCLDDHDDDSDDDYEEDYESKHDDDDVDRPLDATSEHSNKSDNSWTGLELEDFMLSSPVSPTSRSCPNTPTTCYKKKKELTKLDEKLHMMNELFGTLNLNEDDNDTDYKSVGGDVVSVSGSCSTAPCTNTTSKQRKSQRTNGSDGERRHRRRRRDGSCSSRGSSKSGRRNSRHRRSSTSSMVTSETQDTEFVTSTTTCRSPRTPRRWLSTGGNPTKTTYSMSHNDDVGVNTCIRSPAASTSSSSSISSPRRPRRALSAGGNNNNRPTTTKLLAMTSLAAAASLRERFGRSRSTRSVLSCENSNLINCNSNKETVQEEEEEDKVVVPPASTSTSTSATFQTINESKKDQETAITSRLVDDDIANSAISTINSITGRRGKQRPRHQTASNTTKSRPTKSAPATTTTTTVVINERSSKMMIRGRRKCKSMVSTPEIAATADASTETSPINEDVADNVRRQHQRSRSNSLGRMIKNKLHRNKETESEIIDDDNNHSSSAGVSFSTSLRRSTSIKRLFQSNHHQSQK